MIENEDGHQGCVSVDDFQQVAQFLFQRIKLLEDLVENQLIGGIKSLYDTHSRETGISSLKTKYGSKFDPMGDALPALGIPDWASTLFDELKKVQESTPDWDEEKEGSYIDGGIAQLMERISKIAGKPSQASVTVVEGEGAPEGAPEASEAPKKPEGEEGGGEPKDLAKILNDMKNSGKFRD